MDFELFEALKQIEREKGIRAETMIEALEAALLSAYKKNYNVDFDARVEIDKDAGVRVFALETDEETGEVTESEVTPRDFGRIAAQTAKQVIFQRMREAERNLMYDEYHERVGDIVTGIVQQSDHRYTLVDLGKVEALLPISEQIHGERYDHGARIKVFIVEVRKTNKGPQILVSRTHPGLLKRLFELEVPEIGEGYVEIKAVAREPGHRSKIAVVSHDRNIDPVGACVGAKGSRVRMVVNELRGEKVDIVPWSEDARQFVMNALSPARVQEVRIDEAEETAEVIVPDAQLSLAIGKEGQNARLAAKLTGWRIDIKSETQDVRYEAVAEEEAAEEAAADVSAETAEEPIAVDTEPQEALEEETGSEESLPGDSDEEAAEAVALESEEADVAAEDGEEQPDGTEAPEEPDEPVAGP
ncbi:MAG: transcription termination factor NusA [Candidatus Geothermincolia bacterium]